MSVNEERLSTAVSSRTDEVLWGCLRFVVTGESPRVEGGWSRGQLLERATRLHLRPIVYAALPEQFPELNQVARQRRIRNIVMTDEMLRVVAACAARGIRLVPLKGVALANTVYPSPTLRFFDDLDLLVEPEHSAEALQIIHKLGYKPHPRGSADWHHALPQTHPKHGTTIELHTDLTRRYGHEDWPLDGVLTRLQSAEIQGQTVEILSDEDALIHTAIHARHHLFEKATFLLDSALLIARGGYDVGRVRRAGALLPFAYIVEILHDHNMIDPASTVPIDDWRLTVARQVGAWETFAPLAEPLRSGALPKLVELGLMDSLGDALTVGRALLLPDDAFVADKYDSRLQRLTARIGLAGRQILSR